MEAISKKVCLESFISRFNGMLPTLGSINIDEMPVKKETYKDDKYSDYGGIPFDIRFCDWHDIGKDCGELTNESVLAGLIKNLSAITKNLPCVPVWKDEDKNDEKEELNKEALVLRYKTMVNDYKLIYDIANGLSYDNIKNTSTRVTKYYYLCKRNDLNHYEWMEITDEMWDGKIEKAKESSENGFYLDPSLPKFLRFFLLHDKMYLDTDLPSPYLYYYVSRDKRIVSTTSVNDVPYYYVFVNADGELEYVEYEFELPTYYKYKESGSDKEKYAYSPTDIPKEVVDYEAFTPEYSYIRADKLPEVSGIKPTQLFVEGDVICINPNMRDFISKFRNEFAELETWVPYETIDTAFTPTVEAYRDGLIVGKPEEGNDKFVRNYRVIPNPESKRYERYFIELVKYLAENKLTGDELNLISIPFVDIPIYIDGDYHDMGMQSPYYEYWVPNKKYYIGDVVSYGNNCYVLVSAGTEYDLCEVSKAYYETLSDNSDYNNRLEEKDGKYFLKHYYYRGYYDEDTKITRFDDKDSEGNLNHWHLSHTTENDFNEFVPDDLEDEDITLTTTSRLNTLQRYVKSNDDTTGAELPFNYVYDGSDDDEKKKIAMHTEMKYKLGINNITTYNDEVFCDRLDKVTIFYKPAEGETGDAPTQVFTVEYGGDGEMHGEFICSSAVSQNPDEYDSIAFDYTVRYSVNADGEDVGKIDMNSGLHYRDEYLVTLGTMWIECEEYDETNGLCKYRWVEYNDDSLKPQEVDDEYEDADDYTQQGSSLYQMVGQDDKMPEINEENLGEICQYIGTSHSEDLEVPGSTEKERVTYNNGMLYRSARLCKFIYIDVGEPKVFDVDAPTEDGEVQSLVTFKRSMMKHDIFQKLFTYRDEALFGIHDVAKDVGVFVDRGIGTTVIERHSILSEVDTFEDLLNYRNDYFHLNDPQS